MKKYVVNRAKENFDWKEAFDNPTLWNQARTIEDFISPWSTRQGESCSFKALHTKDMFYFRFEVKDPKLANKIQNIKRQEPINNDRVELFFRSNAVQGEYYGMEIDPTGQVHDFQSIKYKELDFNWSWKEKLKCLHQRENDSYTIQGALNLDYLRELKLIKGDTLEMGAFWAIYPLDIEDEIIWSTWVDPSVSEPDFHLPSSFGVFELE